MRRVQLNRGPRSGNHPITFKLHSLHVAGLEELFFQLCCCVSFLVSGGKYVLVLHTYVFMYTGFSLNSYAEDTSGYIVGTYNISD